MVSAAFDTEAQVKHERLTIRQAPGDLRDLLELGGEARMNTPGTADVNWRWRARPGVLTPVLAGRLRKLIQQNGRI